MLAIRWCVPALLIPYATMSGVAVDPHIHTHTFTGTRVGEHVHTHLFCYLVGSVKRSAHTFERSSGTSEHEESSWSQQMAREVGSFRQHQLVSIVEEWLLSALHHTKSNSNRRTQHSRLGVHCVHLRHVRKRSCVSDAPAAPAASGAHDRVHVAKAAFATINVRLHLDLQHVI